MIFNLLILPLFFCSFSISVHGNQFDYVITEGMPFNMTFYPTQSVDPGSPEAEMVNWIISDEDDNKKYHMCRFKENETCSVSGEGYTISTSRSISQLVIPSINYTHALVYKCNDGIEAFTWRLVVIAREFYNFPYLEWDDPIELEADNQITNYTRGSTIFVISCGIKFQAFDFDYRPMPNISEFWIYLTQRRNFYGIWHIFHASWVSINKTLNLSCGLEAKPGFTFLNRPPTRYFTLAACHCPENLEFNDTSEVWYEKDELTCKVSAYPPVQVKIFQLKDGKEVRELGKGSENLATFKLSSNDIGEFVCRVEDSNHKCRRALDMEHVKNAKGGPLEYRMEDFKIIPTTVECSSLNKTLKITKIEASATRATIPIPVSSGDDATSTPGGTHYHPNTGELPVSSKKPTVETKSLPFIIGVAVGITVIVIILAVVVLLVVKNKKMFKEITPSREDVLLQKSSAVPGKVALL